MSRVKLQPTRRVLNKLTKFGIRLRARKANDTKMAKAFLRKLGAEAKAS